MFKTKNTRPWCCAGFEGNYQRGGHRGAGIVVNRALPDHAFFVLQFRAVEPGSEKEVSGPPHISVSLVSDVGMQFCPWCGTNLTEFYGTRINDLYRPGLAIETA